MGAESLDRRLDAAARHTAAAAYLFELLGGPMHPLVSQAYQKLAQFYHEATAVAAKQAGNAAMQKQAVLSSAHVPTTSVLTLPPPPKQQQQQQQQQQQNQNQQQQQLPAAANNGGSGGADDGEEKGSDRGDSLGRSSDGLGRDSAAGDGKMWWSRNTLHLPDPSAPWAVAAIQFYDQSSNGSSTFSDGSSSGSYNPFDAASLDEVRNLSASVHFAETALSCYRESIRRAVFPTMSAKAQWQQQQQQQQRQQGAAAAVVAPTEAADLFLPGADACASIVESVALLASAAKAIDAAKKSSSSSSGGSATTDAPSTGATGEAGAAVATGSDARASEESPPAQTKLEATAMRLSGPELQPAIVDRLFQVSQRLMDGWMDGWINE